MLERGQVGRFHMALRKAKLAKFGETAQISYALIANVDVGKEVKAEIETLEICQSSQVLQLLVRVESAARRRIPAWAGKKEVAKRRETGEAAKVGRIDDGIREIEADNVNLALRQPEGIVISPGMARESHAPARPDRPLRDFALRRRRGLCTNGHGETHDRKDRETRHV